ncbi:uncharacterized protein LOC110914633 [Helianthus annuus]|uniref:uncharacterized protein LOC110914633 n=1 Tax=Helianthus annuus TaxID=4232 RepID=UPI000B902D8A|nr:uncharacterized protein LOC110914633 [Helianthus annuus]
MALHNDRNYGDFIPVKRSLGGVWSNIVQVLNITVVEGIQLKNYFKVAVGNGEETSFWLDHWIGPKPLKDSFPLLFNIEEVKDCNLNCCLGNRNDMVRLKWRWKRPLSSEAEINEMVGLCSLLSQVELNQEKDEWKWFGPSAIVDPDFSVRLVRQLLESGSNRGVNYVPERCKWIPDKCNIFIWRAEMGKIATVDALNRRNIDVGTVCGLCGDGEESVDHLFTSCDVASLLWAYICNWCRCANIVAFSFKDLIEFHNHSGFEGKKKDVLKGLIRIGCWVVWRARNESRFKNSEVNLNHIFGEVKRVGFLWFSSRKKCVSTSWSDWCKFVNL